jgi:DNA-binding SARP family transcriptional activator
MSDSELQHQKQAIGNAYRLAKQNNDIDDMVRQWAAIVDILWAEWEDCFQLDYWIEELAFLRQLIEQQQRNDCLPHLAKGAFAAYSIRDMANPDFHFWETLNLQYLEGELSVEERLMRSLQCMIHYTWGIGNQPKASLILDYLKIMLREDNSSAMVQCIYHVCLGAYQFWFDPDPASSTRTIDAGLKLSQRLDLTLWDVPMLNVALFLTCSSQMEASAKLYLQGLQQRLDDASRPHDFAIFYHFKAYLAWLDTDFDEALFAAEKALHIAEQTGFSFSPVYYGLAVAQILNETGHADEALAHALKLRHQARLYKSRQLEIMALAIACHIAISCQQVTLAAELLDTLFKHADGYKLQRLPWLRQCDARQIADFHALQDEQPASPLPLFLRNMLPDRIPCKCKTKIITLGHLQIITSQDFTSTSRKPPRILIALLLQLIAASPAGVAQKKLMESTWPGVDPAAARSRLKTSLYRLRKLLGEERAIIQQHGVVKLNGDCLDIDCWELIRHYKNTSRSADVSKHAIALYAGSFDNRLCDIPGLQVFQVYLQRIHAEMVLSQVQSHHSSQQYREAFNLLQAALQQDAVNVDFCIELLKTLGHIGSHHAIAATLQTFSENFRRELGMPLPKSITQTAQALQP